MEHHILTDTETEERGSKLRTRLNILEVNAKRVTICPGIEGVTIWQRLSSSASRDFYSLVAWSIPSSGRLPRYWRSEWGPRPCISTSVRFSFWNLLYVICSLLLLLWRLFLYLIFDTLRSTAVLLWLNLVRHDLFYLDINIFTVQKLTALISLTFLTFDILFYFSNSYTLNICFSDISCVPHLSSLFFIPLSCN